MGLLVYIKLLKYRKHEQNDKDCAGNTISFILNWVDVSSYFGLEVPCMDIEAPVIVGLLTGVKNS